MLKQHKIDTCPLPIEASLDSGETVWTVVGWFSISLGYFVMVEAARGLSSNSPGRLCEFLHRPRCGQLQSTNFPGVALSVTWSGGGSVLAC